MNAMTDIGALKARPLAPIVRFDAGTVLAKLESVGLLARGRAHIISLDAIRTAFGARWTERKSIVWDMTETHVMRRLGEQDFFARLSEVDFILVTPKMEPAQSQAIAMRLSREIIEHFLGATEQAQISIKLVTRFSEEQLTCRGLDKDEFNRAFAEDQLTARSKIAAGGTPSSRSSAIPNLKTAGEVTTLSGLQLRFSTSIDPIIDLARWAVAGHRLEPKIAYEATRLVLSSDERRRLLPRDVEAVDLATLGKALQRLIAGDAAGSKPSLILTTSFLSISNTRARTALFNLAYQARSAMMRSVIWEITDFDKGVPPGVLQDCISSLAPYGRTVFVRGEASTLLAASEKSVGRCGLVFQPPSDFDDEEEAASWLVEVSRVAVRRSSTLIAANLPSKNLLPLASSLGFTHATVRT